MQNINLKGKRIIKKPELGIPVQFNDPGGLDSRFE